MDGPRRIRLAAAGDLHYTVNSRGAVRRTLGGLPGHADVLLLCGDLTDNGLPEEAAALADDLRGLGLPTVAVLGNHDFESNRPEEVSEILEKAGVKVLDGESCVVAGVGFVGTKGFGGGFGRHALGPWGEEAIKLYVQAAVDEAMKLERALARVAREPRVVLLHYAPIQATVEGESPEIYPFLGSSRLEEPIDRYGVAATFHGHCHRGSPEGVTRASSPVYNVAMPLLRHVFPGQPPVRVIEVAVPVEERAG